MKESIDIYKNNQIKLGNNFGKEKTHKKFNNIKMIHSTSINYIAKENKIKNNINNNLEEKSFDTFDTNTINTNDILETKFLYLDEDEEELKEKKNLEEKIILKKNFKNKKKDNKLKENINIKSKTWYLLFKNIIADKKSVIKKLKNSENLPQIKEYIVANIKTDTHVYLELNKMYTYNKKKNILMYLIMVILNLKFLFVIIGLILRLFGKEDMI